MKVHHIEVSLSRRTPGSRPTPFGSSIRKGGGGVGEKPVIAWYIYIFLPKLVLRARFIKVHSNSCRREHQGPPWGDLKSGRDHTTPTFYKEVNISAQTRVSSWTEPPAKERKPVHYFWCCYPPWFQIRLPSNSILYSSLYIFPKFRSLENVQYIGYVGTSLVFETSAGHLKGFILFSITELFQDQPWSIRCGTAALRPFTLDVFLMWTAGALKPARSSGNSRIHSRM